MALYKGYEEEGENGDENGDEDDENMATNAPAFDFIQVNEREERKV